MKIRRIHLGELFAPLISSNIMGNVRRGHFGCYYCDINGSHKIHKIIVKNFLLFDLYYLKKVEKKLPSKICFHAYNAKRLRKVNRVKRYMRWINNYGNFYNHAYDFFSLVTREISSLSARWRLCVLFGTRPCRLNKISLRKRSRLLLLEFIQAL